MACRRRVLRVAIPRQARWLAALDRYADAQRANLVARAS